jgi:hypothetical protein
LGGNGPAGTWKASEWFKEHQSPWMALMTVTNWQRALQSRQGPEETPPR